MRRVKEETLYNLAKAAGATLAGHTNLSSPQSEAKSLAIDQPPHLFRNRTPTADEVAKALGLHGDPNIKVRVHTFGGAPGVGPQPDETWRLPDESDGGAQTRVDLASEIIGALNGRTVEDTRALMGISFEVFKEVLRAQAKHAPMVSGHEAYGIIAEEFNKEFLDAIHANDYDAARQEAIQVAAMAIRFIFDVVD